MNLRHSNFIRIFNNPDTYSASAVVIATCSYFFLRSNSFQSRAEFRLLPAILSAFRAAKSTRQINDKAYQQNQAKPAAADDWTAEVKPAAAEQEKQNHDDQ
jgi:hypothetical protein